jgi:hypothetical protein
MSKGKSSGIVLTSKDASIVLEMVKRGDREHDIAAWFGVNQGRIAEVKNGDILGGYKIGPEDMPPKGPPGLKGRRLRAFVVKALALLEEDPGKLNEAVNILREGQRKFDSLEA